ncbi:MAG: GH3 auxin-responsive promoter family protein [Myxococcales bacterium]|nr:GH3 auxin-responsive promoter family protein [Myxococcales bacterium]
MAGLLSRWFRATGFWGGRVMLRRFDRASQQAVVKNRQTLTAILTANADTEFGRTHGFAALSRDPSGAAYRDAVPLATYADFTEAITRMEHGETGVLTADELLFFALSSGTTGTTKLVPTTKRHHGFTFKYMGTVVQGVISNELHEPGPTERGVDLMHFAGEQQLSPGGVPVGSATAEAVRRMARIVPHLWNSPIDVYTLPHQPSARYLHALYGLHNRDNQFVEAVFAPRLLEWIREVVARWDELVHDVRHGTLTDTVDIPDDVRRKVLADNPARSARARELEAATAEGFEGFLTRIWPSMTHLMTITSGSFEVYVPALRRFVGDLPIYTPSYGATESFVGVGLWPDRPGHYVMATDPSYFEFIPTEHVDEAQPDTVDMQGVQEGASYELVVTNYAGLYRYRLGDVVRVVGRHGQAPIIEFLYRRGTQFDVTGEKTNEEHVANALTQLRERHAAMVLEDYTTTADPAASPPRYVVYLELDSTSDPIDADTLQQWAVDFDACLCRANPMVVEYREGGFLGQPRLAVVASGTFARLADLALEGERSPSRAQIKTPRRVDGEAQLALLEDAVVAST